MSEKCGDMRRTTTSSFHAESDSGKADVPASLAGDIIAASILCIVEVVNCISVAMILRGRWPDDQLDPFFRYVTYGLIVHQLVTTALTKIPGVIAPSAFENLVVFLAIQESICEAMKDEPVAAQVVTFMSAMAVSALISSVLLGLVSLPSIAKLLTYLPDYVRHGVFAAIGVGVFKLGFESFELEPFDASTWTNSENLLKWCPAYVFGMALWYMDDQFPSRWLLVGFITFVVGVCHGVRLSYGVSIEQAVKDGWLLGQTGQREFGEYFAATYGSLHYVHWPVVIENLPQLFVASVLGPLLNATINCVVLEGALQITLNYSRELRSQAIGCLCTGFCFGFNSYFAVADTSLMRKAGGTTARPVLLMVFLLICTCVVPPVLPILLVTIPNTLPAAIFVFVGFAIAWGCVADMRTTLRPMEYGFSLLTCALCLYAGVPQGLFFSCAICLVQRFTAIEKGEDGAARVGTSTLALSRISLVDGQDTSQRQLELSNSA